VGQVQREALCACASVVVTRAASKIALLVGEGAPLGQAFTSAQHLLYAACNAHCTTLMATGFFKAVQECADKAIANVLRDVCSLFCLSQLEEVGFACGWSCHCRGLMMNDVCVCVCVCVCVRACRVV